MLKLYKSNGYTTKQQTGIGANSLSLTDNHFVVKASGVVGKSVGAGVIDGVNDTIGTFASDNQTVAKANVDYTPAECNRTYAIDVTGQEIVFAGALITSNVINLKVNGTAMTAVTFSSNDATTLGLIATQLTTDFPTIIKSATAGTNKVTVVPYDTNDTCEITDIVVTLGTTQTTGTVSALELAVTDEDSYYDLAQSNTVNISSKSATTGQVQLISVINEAVGEFKIVNA